jgi:hypothetical protein
MPNVYRYPNQEIYEDTDYLRIAIVNYTPVGEQLVGRRDERRKKTSAKERIATVLLPMPSNLVDNNSVSYTDDSLNALAAAIAGGSADIMTEGAKLNFSDLGKKLQDRITATGMDFGDAKDLITRQLSSQAAAIFGGNVSLNQIQARTDGTIFNPNMELLFNGPTLRSFRFQFKMTPRNDDEMKQIKSIIRSFKKNMSPKTVPNKEGATGTLFLKTPSIFELTYMQGGKKHNFLHNFKQCFLENMSVNYTGEGTYSTYDDGTPISMIMDLQFKETEPVYDSDYDDEEGKSGVGY